MVVSRREFLKSSSLGVMTGAALLRSPFAFADRYIPPSATHDMVSGVRKMTGTGQNDKFFVRRTAFDTGKMVDIPIPFEAHSFVQHPQMKERVWVIENFGGNCAEIDFKQGKITRELKLPETEHKFMGHGFFAPDASEFSVTCLDEKSGDGHFAVFEGGSFKMQEFRKVTPGNLHQCMLLPDETVYITSLGRKEGARRNEADAVERSSLVRTNLNGEFIGKQFLESDIQSIGHFAVMTDGTVIAVTRTVGGQEAIAGTAYVSDKGTAPFKEIMWPEELRTKFKSSMLGVAVDEKNNVAVISNPQGGLMMFLDTRDWSVKGHLEKTAKGIELLPATSEFYCSGADEFRVPSTPKYNTYDQVTITGSEGLHNQHNLLVPKI